MQSPLQMSFPSAANKIRLMTDLIPNMLIQNYTLIYKHSSCKYDCVYVCMQVCSKNMFLTDCVSV